VEFFDLATLLPQFSLSEEQRKEIWDDGMYTIFFASFPLLGSSLIFIVAILSVHQSPRPALHSSRLRPFWRVAV
jgi:hypothetical protein